jgi:hypothetical protein
MTAKTTKYTREWLVEAIKLSLSSLKRGEDEKVVARRLNEALDGFLKEKRGALD